MLGLAPHAHYGRTPPPLVGRLHDLPRQRAARRWLRSHGTPAEACLWPHLKNGQTGYRFRRQHGIGRYIVDFYCHAARLAVELDGEVHDRPEHAAYDAERTAALASLGVRVIRFRNRDVFADARAVAVAIAEACASAPAQ